MSIRKKLLASVMILFLFMGAMFAGSWFTGGKSLIFVYGNYLAKDIPEKQYSYKDFTDRGPREMLHGYYAGSDNKSFYMWTLLGLKRFYHRSANTFYSPTARINPIKPESTVSKI